MRSRISIAIISLLFALSSFAVLATASAPPAAAYSQGYIEWVYWPVAYSTDFFYKSGDGQTLDLWGFLSDINNPNRCDYDEGWYLDGGGTWRTGASGWHYQCQNPYVSNSATYITSVYTGTQMFLQGYWGYNYRVVAVY